MRLVFIGPPGIGKGTHTKRLAKETGFPHISTGDMLREGMDKKTKTGLYAKTFLEAGELVPCDVVIEMVMQRLSRKDCERGFFLDGFPRTLNQAEIFDEQLKQKSLTLDYAVEFYVQEEERELIKRVAGRRFCTACPEWYHIVNKPARVSAVCDACGAPLYQRFDDTEETLRKRLSIYHQLAGPLVAYYERRKILVRVNAGGPIARTYETLLKVIGLS